MAAPSATTTQWYDHIRDDLQQVEQKMRDSSMMGHTKLDLAVDSIISAGGKRMRPAITLLVGQLFGAQKSTLTAIAASIELLHTATLVHDDLIDGAAERRGAPTLHSQLPIGITVLTGDFLFAQSAALAAEANSVRVVQLFAETLVRICKGEILQAQTRWTVPSQDIYEERIYGKTAALFEAAATAAALLGDAQEETMHALSDFGRSLGLAFQIVDDALDFVSTAQHLGKPAGHDMSQGIFNLPVMFYVESGWISEGDLVRRLGSENGDFNDLVASIRSTGMVEKSLEVARQYAQRAIDTLSTLPYSGSAMDYLLNLTQYALARTY